MRIHMIVDKIDIESADLHVRRPFPPNPDLVAWRRRLVSVNVDGERGIRKSHCVGARTTLLAGPIDGGYPVKASHRIGQVDSRIDVGGTVGQGGVDFLAGALDADIAAPSTVDVIAGNVGLDRFVPAQFDEIRTFN